MAIDTLNSKVNDEWYKDRMMQENNASQGSNEPLRFENVQVHMPASRIVLIAAEHGMGRSTTLSHTVLQYVSSGIPARYFEFQGLTCEDAHKQMREAQRWCRLQKENARLGAPRAMVACDNVCMGDENDVYRLAKIIRGMANANYMVMVAMLPEGEMLAEQLGEAVCLWSCDLRAPTPESEPERRVFEEYAQGVPLLVSALNKVGIESWNTVAADPSYQEPMITLFEACVRDGMMDEERRIRCAMLLMGSGGRGELESAVGAIEEDLWRIQARDVPLLGVDTIGETFRCVGAHSHDCLNVAFSVLSNMAHPWPDMVSSVANVLAERNDISRAGIVSLMCSDEMERCSIGLRWGAKLINAGEIGVADNAFETARKKGLLELEGYAETACILASLKGDKPSERELELIKGEHNGLRARRAELAQWCYAVLHGHCVEDDVRIQKEDDTFAGQLVTHGSSMAHMAQGRFHTAYELLLNAGSGGKTITVGSSVVAMDYLLCTLLMGVVPNRSDMEVLESSVTFLEQCGLGRIAARFDLLLRLGTIMSGRLLRGVDFEIPVQRAAREGNEFVRGVFLLAAGVSDMRIGALTRAHVRLGQAVLRFNDLRLHKTAKMARLLHCAVRAQLGERISKSDVASCQGVSRIFDDVVQLLAVSLAQQKPKRFASVGGWGATSQSREVHWILNILSNDCGKLSKRFRKVMPVTWVDAQIRIAAEVDGFYGHIASNNNDNDAPRLTSQLTNELHMQKNTVRHVVEVRMLGGFEVYVMGSPIPSNRLERRKAKALLALLVALPGHVAKRYTIMESIWPTYDYTSASKCVYSATSVLRAEFARALQKKEELVLVISNKAQGTISLNTSGISCDVDAFEEKARRLLDMEGVDREVVSLCRDIEEIYRGDLFVPPTDGMGIIQTRARDLKALYADTMIAGANAALNTGMKTLACRFARKAHDIDNMREDAMKTLVLCLCETGRHVEAGRFYERFVGRVVDFTRRPPSRRLRAEVETLLSGCLPDMSERLRNLDLHNVQYDEVDEDDDEAREGQLRLDLDVDDSPEDD